MTYWRESNYSFSLDKHDKKIFPSQGRSIEVIKVHFFIGKGQLIYIYLPVFILMMKSHRKFRRSEQKKTTNEENGLF